jgi:hypothetical protein
MIAAPQITALKRTTILDTPDWGAPAAPTCHRVMGVTMRLRANNLLIAVSKLIWTTNLRMCANKLLILDNHSQSGNYVCGGRYPLLPHSLAHGSFAKKHDLQQPKLAATLNVRFWHKADVVAAVNDVRFRR